MECPRCDGKLAPHNYEGVEIDSCEKCGGSWLDLKELTHIIQNEEESFSKELVEKTIRAEFAGIPDEENEVHESCPRCGDKMHPLNYAYSSGIIIDRCPKHGVWLDKGELEKVQASREQWQKKAKESKDHWEAMAQKITDNQEEFNPNQGISSFSFINRIINFIVRNT